MADSDDDEYDEDGDDAMTDSDMDVPGAALVNKRRRDRQHQEQQRRHGVDGTSGAEDDYPGSAASGERHQTSDEDDKGDEDVSGGRSQD